MFFSFWYFDFRGHPKVKKIDMLHAADYANMQIGQMNRKVNQSKLSDEAIARAIEYVLFLYITN